MSVAFGLSPREVERVADETPELLAAMRDSYGKRWTTETELLAGIYEVCHATYVATLAAAGVKRHELPKPVRVPRPGEDQQKKKPASSAELARWMNTRRGGGSQ